MKVNRLSNFEIHRKVEIIEEQRRKRVQVKDPLAFESGANPKEGQTLARHSTPQLTMNVYARARDEKLSDIVEKVGNTVLSDSKRAIYVHSEELSH